MMGRTHAATGVLLASIGSLVTSADVPSALVALMVLPGLALLNDIDHPNSTVSRSFGWWTSIPARFMKHRNSTHSIPGITTFALITWAAISAQGGWLANAWIAFILAAPSIAALRALKIVKWKSWVGYLPILPAIAIAWFPADLAASGMAVPLNWLPLAVWLGMFTHILGDVVTRGGCPLFWPISKHRTQLSWFKTNSRGELIALVLIWILILVTTATWFALTIAPHAGT